MLEEYEIDILSMQETEIDNKLNHEELSNANYNLELETNSVKSRVGYYISKSVSYVRRFDLEGTDSNIIIVDLEGNPNTRLINFQTKNIDHRRLLCISTSFLVLRAPKSWSKPAVFQPFLILQGNSSLHWCKSYF